MHAAGPTPVDPVAGDSNHGQDDSLDMPDVVGSN